MGAPKLTERNIEKAIEILDDWEGRLIWDLYLYVLEREIGHRYTKAAISRHVRIKNAWNLAKKKVRKDSSHSTSDLEKENKKLRSTIERVNHENKELLEQFVRWAFNATSKGLSLEDLDRPIPRSTR